MQDPLRNLVQMEVTIPNIFYSDNRQNLKLIMYPVGDKMLKHGTITRDCSFSKYVSEFQGNSVKYYRDVYFFLDLVYFCEGIHVQILTKVSFGLSC